MGRHSVADDEDEGASALVAAPVEPAERRGRHARVDEDELAPDEQRTQMIAVVDAELVETVEEHDTHQTDEIPAVPAAVEPAEESAEREATKRAAKQQPEAAKKAARGESDTQADLRVLRQSAAVRLQCVAAVVVAFGVYTLVMALLGRLGDYVYWVWIPIAVSGVGIGAVLDLAHRRERSTASR